MPPKDYSKWDLMAQAPTLALSLANVKRLRTVFFSAPESIRSSFKCGCTHLPANLPRHHPSQMREAEYRCGSWTRARTRTRTCVDNSGIEAYPFERLWTIPINSLRFASSTFMSSMATVSDPDLPSTEHE
jgi:hypothetical protein